MNKKHLICLIIAITVGHADGKQWRPADSISLNQEHTSKPFGGDPIAPLISPDGTKQLGATYGDGYWVSSIWSFDGKIKYSFTDKNTETYYINSTVSEEGNCIAYSVNLGYVSIYAIKNNSLVYKSSWAPQAQIIPRIFALNNDGSLLAIVIENEIYVTSTEDTSKQIVLPNNAVSYSGLKWRGKQLVAFGGSPARIDFWNITTQIIDKTLSFPNFKINDVYISEKNNFIGVAGEDKLYPLGYFKVIDENGNQKGFIKEKNVTFTWGEAASDGETWVTLSASGKNISKNTYKKHKVRLWKNNNVMLEKEILPDTPLQLPSKNFSIRWIKNEVVKWAYFSGDTGSIGT